MSLLMWSLAVPNKTFNNKEYLARHTQFSTSCLFADLIVITGWKTILSVRQSLHTQKQNKASRQRLQTPPTLTTTFQNMKNKWGGYQRLERTESSTRCKQKWTAICRFLFVFLLRGINSEIYSPLYAFLLKHTNSLYHFDMYCTCFSVLDIGGRLYYSKFNNTYLSLSAVMW